MIQTAPSRQILYCSIPSQKQMVRKNRLEKSRWGLEETWFLMVFFLISVHLITVTIQRLTYTLNSYINPYSLPHMYCRFFSNIHRSYNRYNPTAYLHSEFLYKPIFPSEYALSAFYVAVRRFRFCLVFSGRYVFP
jgi:hypothetical protein